MKFQIIFLSMFSVAFGLISSPARAQADSARFAAEQKVPDHAWAPAEKVNWSQEDPNPGPTQAGEWLDGVEALQKVAEYPPRQARRVKREALHAQKRDRRAARQARKQAQADEKPRRIRN
jgi:hypothetical protein